MYISRFFPLVGDTRKGNFPLFWKLKVLLLLPMGLPPVFCRRFGRLLHQEGSAYSLRCSSPGTNLIVGMLSKLEGESGGWGNEEARKRGSEKVKKQESEEGGKDQER